MAKLHNRGEAAELLKAVGTFLQACRSPAVLEDGDTPMALLPGSFLLEVRGERLCLEASTEARMLSRRITSVDQHRSGILDCTVQRFGGSEGRITFLDLGRPQTSHRQVAATRRSFAEQFRRMLHRQFPQWEIQVLSSSMDLRRSFSSLFPRATLTLGNQLMAAMACPSAEHESEFLTFALLWFHHMRNGQSSLCLFLPDSAGCLTAHRLRWLRREVLRSKIYLFNEHGSAGEVDPQDLGNLDTRVGSRFAQVHVSGVFQSLLHRLSDLPHVSQIQELSGHISIRFRGTEFARIEEGRMQLGLTEGHFVSVSELDSVYSFALSLVNLAEAAPSLPERWLEGVVRSNLPIIDVNLLPAPVHGQVLTFAGRDRDAVDLLAVSPGGRLTVLELKATEDLHLPLQALDYWMRIKWHCERQELTHLFPGVSLTSQAPRLQLIAPALSFHSTSASVLRYFSPEIEVERVGVNSDWATRFRVVLRLMGAECPISHADFAREI